MQRPPRPAAPLPEGRQDNLRTALAAMEDQTLTVKAILRELAKAEADRAAVLEERLTAQYNLTSGLARHLTSLHQTAGDQLDKAVEYLPPDVPPLIGALAQRIAKQHDQTRADLTAQIAAHTPEEVLRRLTEVVEVINGRHDELAVLLAKSIATDPLPKLVELGELMINQHRQLASRIADLAERVPADPTEQLVELAKKLPTDPTEQIAELTRLVERISVQQHDTDQRIAEMTGQLPPDAAPQITDLTARLGRHLEETRALLSEQAEQSTQRLEDIQELWNTPLRVDTSTLEVGQTQVAAKHAQDIADLRRDLSVLLNAIRQRDDEVTQLHRDVAWLVRQLGGA